MDQQFPTFFETNDYFIDQKVNMFKFEREYKIFDDKGAQIGMIKQRLGAGSKLLSLLINRSMMPFRLEIVDAENKVLATISRGWTFFMSKIEVKDTAGEVVGIIKQKMKFFKPTFFIHDATMKKIAEINGDWKAWNFTIKDESGAQIGTVNKKWGGIMKEAFTSADKYWVSIQPEFKENTDKIVIVSTAITIDMVLKENK